MTKRSVAERLAASVQRREALEARVDIAIARLPLAEGSVNEVRLHARRTILIGFDSFAILKEEIEAGPGKPYEGLHAIAAAAESFLQLLEESPWELGEMNSFIDVTTAIRSVRDIKMAAGRVAFPIIDLHARFDEARSSQQRLALVVAKASIAAYQDVTGQRATANNNPITNERESKFISFFSDVLAALDINASAGNTAQEALKAIRQKSA
jgi:hypothetical protein